MNEEVSRAAAAAAAAATASPARPIFGSEPLET